MPILKLNDLIVVTIAFVALNALMWFLGKYSIWDFLFYTSVIAYCDFVVAIYVQFRFATAEKMGKMVESVEDLIKKLSKKKGKKRLAKALKKAIEEDKVTKIEQQGASNA
jgi:hypothetical protein